MCPICWFTFHQTAELEVTEVTVQIGESVYSRMTLLLRALTLKVMLTLVGGLPARLQSEGVWGSRDERTVNTATFEAAVAEKGAGRLTVPAGWWLTVPFNFTRCMTLFLAGDAEILGIQVRHSPAICSALWIL